MVNGHHGSVSMSVGQVLEFMAPFSPIYTTLLLSIGSVSGLCGSSDVGTSGLGSNGNSAKWSDLGCRDLRVRFKDMGNSRFK